MQQTPRVGESDSRPTTFLTADPFRFLVPQAAIAHARSNEPSPVENLSAFFGNARQMAQLLIELAEKPSTVSSVSLDAFFPKLVGMAPSPLLLPTQEALTVALPFAFSGNHKDHNPFPHKVVTVKSES